MRLEAPDDQPLTAATQQIVETLAPAAVVLYGSRATGRETPGSDYDLAVLIAGTVPGWEIVKGLEADLEDVLAARADLVILDDASPILAMQVLRDGRLIACPDAQALENFTVRMLTDYADLKITRREAERHLMESKRR